MSKRLFLIDGYSTIFRAFYALPQLSSSSGEPTNATFGFAKMLMRLLREERPDLIGIAFDVSGDTIRKESYAEYKANRAPMPEELRSQIPAIRRLVEAYRIPILEVDRYEADDVLGTLAKRAAEAGYEVTLVTADKDLMQLVDDRIKLYHTLRDRLFDAAAVEEYFGVPPQQVRDVMALLGDKIDNVPGVPGIGKVGAKKLILEHGSLEALLEHAEEIKSTRYREGLVQHEEQARLSKELVTIHTDLDVPFDPESLRWTEPDTEQLATLFRELEFFSLLDELGASGTLATAHAAATECTDPETVAQVLGRDEGAVAVALLGSPPVALAVSTDGGSAHLLDFRRDGIESAARTAATRLLERSAVTVIGHDLKELLRFACAGGWSSRRLEARLADLMLIAYLLRSGARNFTLEEIAFERLHARLRKLADAGWEKDQPPMPGHGPLLELGGERALVIWQLHERLRPELAGETGVAAGAPQRVYDEIEAPLVPVLLRMEEAGIGLDVELLAQMSRDFGARLGELEAEIYGGPKRRVWS